MAEKNNTTCAICGKGYHKCISCKGSVSTEPWKIHCDTVEHYKIFQIINGFNTGVYTKDEANEKLKSVDLSDLNNLRDHVKKIIKNITKEDKKQVKAKEYVKPVAVDIKTEKIVINTEDTKPSFDDSENGCSETIGVQTLEDAVE